MIVVCYAQAHLGTWPIKMNPFSRQEARWQSKYIFIRRMEGKDLGHSTVRKKRCDKFEAVHQQFLSDVCIKSCI